MGRMRSRGVVMISIFEFVLGFVRRRLLLSLGFPWRREVLRRTGECMATQDKRGRIPPYLEKLRQPMAELNPKFFTLEYGFRS